jgi:hypothetical protein
MIYLTAIKPKTLLAVFFTDKADLLLMLLVHFSQFFSGAIDLEAMQNVKLLDNKK